MDLNVKEDQRIGQAASAIIGRDVNIWLVSDLGILTSNQHCQVLCRMQ